MRVDIYAKGQNWVLTDDNRDHVVLIGPDGNEYADPWSTAHEAACERVFSKSSTLSRAIAELALDDNPNCTNIRSLVQRFKAQ